MLFLRDDIRHHLKGSIAMIKSANGFPLRVNHDGTRDSICPRCFRTVAKAASTDEIDRVEKLHKCLQQDMEIVRQAKVELAREDSATR
jgi:hypothetical protein